MLRMFLCWIGFHDFDRWEDATSDGMYQKTQCKVCNIRFERYVVIK